MITSYEEFKQRPIEDWDFAELHDALGEALLALEESQKSEGYPGDTEMFRRNCKSWHREEV